MGEYRRRFDRYLGLGGMAIAVIALGWRLIAIAVPGEYDWLDSIAAVLGAMVVVVFVTIAVRHRRVHSNGAGRGLLITSWVIAAVIVGFDVLQGVGNGYVGIFDWMFSIAGSFHVHTVPLAVPLLLASLAILRDAGGLVDAANLHDVDPTLRREVRPLVSPCVFVIRVRPSRYRGKRQGDRT